MSLRPHGGTKKIAHDFSVNLNPVIDEKRVKTLLCSMAKYAIKYPEERGESLVKVIAEKENINSENIVLGNGSMELFYHLFSVLKPKRAFTLEPTFCEYGYICEVNSIKLNRILPIYEFCWDFAYIKSLLKEGDLVFICNPNNPTGTLFNKKDILDLAKTGAFIVIDEAFMDFSSNNQSLLNMAQSEKNIIVVKSLTKIYSIAGLRIGFLVASAEIANKFRKILPLWNVNGLAIEIAKSMLMEQDLIERTKRYVCMERNYLVVSMSKFRKLKVYNGEANFFLCKSELAKKLQSFLLSKDVYIRDNCGFYSLTDEFFRIAVKKRKENRALIKILSEFFEAGNHGI